MSIVINTIEKDGYEIKSNKAYMFSSGGYKMLQSFSDPEKPVIFHAWKKIEAEPLYYGEFKRRFPQDGQFHSVNMLGLGGAMQVSFTVDPKATDDEPLDWIVRLKVDGGGVIETTEIFMNEAPKDGYLSSWSKSYKKTDPQFTDFDKVRKFYVKGLNGSVYGRMEVRFITFYGGNFGVMKAKYWLNPNGSRNLQYDRSKRIQ